MRTWEMLSRIMQNTNLVFINQDGERAIYEKGYLTIKGYGEYSFEENDNDIWYELGENTDFISAVKSGKKVCVDDYFYKSHEPETMKNTLQDIINTVDEYNYQHIFTVGLWLVKDE